MIILDANVISVLMRPGPDPRDLAWFDGQPRTSLWTTAVTVHEIRFGLNIMPAGRRRSTLLQAFETALERMGRRVAAFDAAAAEGAADLMAARQRTGRPGDLRDTMIAGIGLAHQATLAARNTAHFEDLSIPVIDPWTA